MRLHDKLNESDPIQIRQLLTDNKTLRQSAGEACSKCQPSLYSDKANTHPSTAMPGEVAASACNESGFILISQAGAQA